ncbi:uncharacterized protein B0H64DRAFT_367803 [Chaetomium fimeti]|uniref:Rhodopsin domain-containing protein n=1 Tax=Chaetomium fimeti TaxID=1854472 RepID=A0AAE0H768_9PEZI|nr:hypothetical protein B0H64DRAFT_367803 [Chaetomium fimeti]
MDPKPVTPAIGPDTDRRVSFEAIVWALVGLSSAFMALRIWARTYSRILGTDDLYMAACWLTFVALGVVAALIGESGGTRHFAYLTLAEKEYQIKLQIVLQAIAIPCTAFGKIAVAFTILRIIKQSSVKWHVWSLWALIVLTAVTSALDVFLVLFHCGDPNNLWDLVGQASGSLSCLDKAAVYNYNTFTAAFQAFADFYLALLPVHIIWGLQMRLGRKLALMALLGLTTVTGVAASVKTWLASKSLGVAADVTWDMYVLAVLTSVEITLIVICGSVPALGPLWDRFVRRRKRHGHGYRSTASYTVSDYNYSSARPDFHPGSKQSSHIAVSTTTAEAGNSEDGDPRDVELASLTEMHARGAL